MVSKTILTIILFSIVANIDAQQCTCYNIMGFNCGNRTLDGHLGGKCDSTKLYLCKSPMAVAEEKGTCDNCKHGLRLGFDECPSGLLKLLLYIYF